MVDKNFWHCSIENGFSVFNRSISEWQIYYCHSLGLLKFGLVSSLEYLLLTGVEIFQDDRRSPGSLYIGSWFREKEPELWAKVSLVRSYFDDGRFILSTLSEGAYRYLFHSGWYLPVNKFLDSVILAVLPASLDGCVNNGKWYIHVGLS